MQCSRRNSANHNKMKNIFTISVILSDTTSNLALLLSAKQSMLFLRISFYPYTGINSSFYHFYSTKLIEVAVTARSIIISAHTLTIIISVL
jgi:hypothetical protein